MSDTFEDWGGEEWDALNAVEHFRGEHPEGCTCQEPKPTRTGAAMTDEKLRAQIRLLIHDLDNARADGTVLTYGYIQHRLTDALSDQPNGSE